MARHRTSPRKRRLITGLAVLVGCATWSGSGPPQERSVEAPRGGTGELLAGATIHGSLAGGERRRYPVPVPAAHYLQLEVRQQGVDVILRLLAPDRRLLLETDGWNGAWGPERIAVVTDRAGLHFLEIVAAHEVAAPGRFTIHVAERGMATPRNRLRVEGDRALADGRRLDLIGTLQTSREAAARFDSALRSYTGADDPAGQADALVGLGSVRLGLGEHAQSLPLFDQALRLARALPDRRREAEVLTWRAMAHKFLGQRDRALDDLSRALITWRTVAESDVAVTRILALLGVTYSELGDESNTRAYTELAVRKARELGGAYTLCGILLAQGSAELWIGNPQGALAPLQEALALSRRLEPGEYPFEPEVLAVLGTALGALERDDEAREVLTRALEELRRNGNRRLEVVALLNLAASHGDPSDERSRRELAEEALQLSRDLGYRDKEATALALLARSALEGGRLEEARLLAEEALGIREERWRLAPTPSLEYHYLANLVDVYALYSEILLRTGRDRSDPVWVAKAFEAIERSRARVLQRRLLEARNEIRGEVSIELLERRRALGKELFARRSAGGGKGSIDMAGQDEVLAAQLREVERRIQASSPRYAALMLPDPITIDEVQSQLLDQDTVLLEYSLGAEGSYLWAVDRSSVRVFDLPRRELIEAAARAVVLAATARGTAVRFETAEERRTRVGRSDLRFAEASRALSRIVLGPAVSTIAAKRLVIVADGALHYVPWSALPVVVPEGDEAAERPLAAEYEIVLLPSTAALREIRRAFAGRRAPAKTLAVIADPVLDSRDPRLRRPAGSPPQGASSSRAIAARGESRRSEHRPRAWPGLPHAREEAMSILGMVPARERLGAFGFAANRKLVMGPDLAGYRILHFATHADVDSEQPELSSIVLSTFDERGRPRDGSLSMFDLYQLQLAADLVVLSGCRTALGKEIRGEGLVGLTRGFMFAGAPRVLVSLWDVQDRATAVLMKRFYELLLIEGRSPAAALRGAQLSMAGSEQWREPYYWAGFVLQGDWRGSGEGVGGGGVANGGGG